MGPGLTLREVRRAGDREPKRGGTRCPVRRLLRRMSIAVVSQAAQKLTDDETDSDGRSTSQDGEDARGRVARRVDKLGDLVERGVVQAGHSGLGGVY